MQNVELIGNIIVSYLAICFCVGTIALTIHGMAWLDKVLGGDSGEQQEDG